MSKLTTFIADQTDPNFNAKQAEIRAIIADCRAQTKTKPATKFQFLNQLQYQYTPEGTEKTHTLQKIDVFDVYTNTKFVTGFVDGDDVDCEDDPITVAPPNVETGGTIGTSTLTSPPNVGTGGGSTGVTFGGQDYGIQSGDSITLVVVPRIALGDVLVDVRITPAGGGSGSTRSSISPHPSVAAAQTWFSNYSWFSGANIIFGTFLDTPGNVYGYTL